MPIALRLDRVAPEAVRLAWSEVNARLTAAMAALPPEEWLKKHGAVSDEDFAERSPAQSPLRTADENDPRRLPCRADQVGIDQRIVRPQVPGDLGDQNGR